MNFKHLLFGVLLIVFLTTPANAVSCSNTDKAKQYALDGESVTYWGYTKIEKNDFCVYEFTNKNPAFSEVIIFGENMDRTVGTNLEESIFSYKTAKYLERDYPSIQPALQDTYNEFITNAHKYSSKLSDIRKGVEFYSQFIQLDIPIYGGLKLDAISSLKYLVFNTVFNPDWDEVVERYKSYKETVDQIGMAKQKGWVSYDNEVKVFFKNSIAIESFIKAIDNKTNSNLQSKFISSNFEALAKEISRMSMTEVELIDKRVKEKRTRAMSETSNFESKQSILLSGIEKSLEKEIDTSKYEKTYCYYKSNKIDTLLIDKELFQDYIDASKKAQSDVQQSIDELDNQMNKSKDKFSLLRLFSKIRWGVKSSLFC